METGQSEPKINRSDPNAVSATSRYGSRSPYVQSALRHGVDSGQLAAHVGFACQLSQVRRPRIQRPGRDRWLAEVIEHEAQRGVRAGGCGGRAQVLRAQHEVEGKPEALEHVEPTSHHGRNQPAAGIDFSKRLMPDPHEMAAARQFVHHICEPGVAQIGPADDASDDVVALGAGQELCGLVRVVDDLHQNHALYRRCGRHSLEIRQSSRSDGSRRPPVSKAGRGGRGPRHVRARQSPRSPGCPYCRRVDANL